MAQIFISHAHKDKKLVDALADLLRLTLEIKTSDIFCTSLEGMGVPSGENFISFIKEKIQDPKIVIIILSSNYYESHFCLCELGASWALSHKKLVLTIPPLAKNDLGGVLSGVQVDKIDDLDGFIDEIKEALSIKDFKTPVWNSKKDQFLKKLPSILKSLPQPERVSLEKYEKLQGENKEYKLTYKKQESEIEELKNQIKKLKKCKNAEDVKKVEKELT